MARVDRILESIDAGMDGNVIYLPGDHIRRLEDEVWAELSEWHDHEEATRMFLAWRETHRPIGSVALNEVEHPQD